MFLSLVWFKIYPANFGGQKGIALFNKYLSTHYPVDCLCAFNNIPDNSTGCAVTPILPVGKLQFLNPFVWKRICSYFKRGKFTHVIIEYPYYGLIGFLLKKLGAVFILHAHNIESDRFKGFGKWWWPILRWYENWCMRKADLILFKTKQDHRFAQESFHIALTKGFVLPYGVEKMYWGSKQESRTFLQSRHQISPRDRVILFSGTLDYAPNAEALLAIYQQLDTLLCKTLTEPYKILVTGRNEMPAYQYLKRLRSTNIIQTGFVEDIGPYFRGADLFINPVLNTYGIQTKILDALSYSCNVVTFQASSTELPSYLLNRKIFVSKNNDYSDFASKIAQALFVDYDTPVEFFDDYGWDNQVTHLIDHLSNKGLL